ncbi:SAF domain-containing protein [Catenulispora sp. GP43]|uniref:SAF domain-containing protein n=1 Tax=Catenulispora sp. GP43 TaxID=3156263 RepID=UPI003511F5CF
MAVPIPAGQRVTAEDLRTTGVAADAAVGLIPESQEDQVVGRIAAVPLVAGDLVTEGKIGSSAVFPPAGQAVTSAELKAGSFPAELKAGDQVAVQINAEGQGSVQVPQSPAVLSNSAFAVSADVMGVRPPGPVLLGPRRAGPRGFR